VTLVTDLEATTGSGIDVGENVYLLKDTCFRGSLSKFAPSIKEEQYSIGKDV
jgi:hypothetical protein